MSIKKILINTILGGVLIVFSPLIYSLPLTIQLTGLAEPERLQVLNSLTIYNAKDSQTLTKEQMISFHQLASLEIKEALESLGYYHAVLISTLRPSIHEEWLAEYEITPNKQTHIQNVRISITGPGSHEPLLQKIIQNNALKKGDAFKHALYDETKKNLINTAIELGYIQALLSNNTVYLNRNTNLADIELILATGPLYHFGEVDFENTVYPADFLSKYITFKKGDPYTAYQLLAFQKALTETNLFSKIRFYPEVAKGENLDVPLKVKLNNKPKNKYTASLGYGTDTYYRMMFGWEKKLLVLPGHKINIDLKASKIQNRIQLRYSLPGKRPRQENKEFIMRVLQYKTPDYFSERSDISMSKFKRVGAWNQIWTLMYLTELYRFTPDTQKLRSHFLLPTAHVIWSRSDKEDNYIKKGLSFGISASGGWQKILSSTNFIQTNIELKGIYTFKHDIRFLGRTDVGITRAKDFYKVPLSLRFMTGGDKSVRGYKYRAIGPIEIDDTGRRIVVGGRYQWINSIEFDKKITEELRIAAFIDAGNAMNHFKDKLKIGTGIGIRWATPVGPLHVDIAYPLSKEIPRRYKRYLHVTFGWEL